MSAASTSTFNSFLVRLDNDQKLLLGSMKTLSARLQAYEETEVFLSEKLPETLLSEVVKDFYMSARLKPTGYVNLDVGFGLTVQLTPQEAIEYIGKAKIGIRDRIQTTQTELVRIDNIRKEFEANFSRLGMALDGVLARYGIE